MTHEEALQWLEKAGGDVEREDWAEGQFQCVVTLEGYEGCGRWLERGDEEAKRAAIADAIEEMKRAVDAA